MCAFVPSPNIFVCAYFKEGRVGWSGGAMVLGKLPVPGRPTIWIIVGQGPTALAVGAGGGCFDIFTLIYPFFPLSPSLWETARYRLKYCLKGPLNPKPSNQPTSRKVRVMQTEKSSDDESSKTNSTIKSSCGNWTNRSVRGSVHEVTHRCETFHAVVVFFCSHYCAEKGELFSSTYRFTHC